MADVHDVAAALVAGHGPMTAMKLQKLAYYGQAWHLAEYHRPLFDEPVQAWVQGPVVPELYQAHRGQRTVDAWPEGDPDRLGADERATIDSILGAYGDFSAEYLSEMTHLELPWRTAREGLPVWVGSSREISRDLMGEYYRRQRVDPDTAVELAVANARLEGVEIRAEWRETIRDVAHGRRSANDVIAERIARVRGT